MLKSSLSAILAMTLAAGAAFAGSHLVDGQVVKIDKSAAKITLKHGPIKTLDMDSMTMVFRVVDPALLDKVSVGDKVRFEAGRVNGAITVTAIEKAK